MFLASCNLQAIWKSTKKVNRDRVEGAEGSLLKSSLWSVVCNVHVAYSGRTLDLLERGHELGVEDTHSKDGIGSAGQRNTSWPAIEKQ